MKTIKKIIVVILAVIAINATAQTEKATFQCNFDCPSCKEKVMKNIPYEKGVKSVEVDYDNKLVTIEYKEGKNSPNDLKAALVKLGYNTQIMGTPTSFIVKGNCGMCKNKIETAAKSINGVSSALWEAASQNLTVVYNKSTTEIETIHKAIANVGYDTDKLKAEDEVYNKLHSCCKYDR